MEKISGQLCGAQKRRLVIKSHRKVPLSMELLMEMYINLSINGRLSIATFEDF